MASNADATAGRSKGWHDPEAVLAEEPVARLMATYLAHEVGGAPDEYRITSADGRFDTFVVKAVNDLPPADYVWDARTTLRPRMRSLVRGRASRLVSSPVTVAGTAAARSST